MRLVLKINQLIPRTYFKNMSINEDSGSSAKKIISVIVVLIVVLGFGYFLFKISPEEKQKGTSNYNKALSLNKPSPILLPSNFDPASERYQGNPNAKNVFVEYADFQCPACAAFSEILKPVPSEFKDTVFVYRYFPLVQIHANSLESAMAAEAAGAQGKYWEMHDLLFKMQTDWQDLADPLEVFAGYAKEVGVANLDQFKSDIVNKKYLSMIQKNSDEAAALNLPGTPSLFFNGHALKNDVLEGLKKQAEAYYVK